MYVTANEAADGDTARPATASETAQSIGLPYSPKTRQMQGRATEKRVLKSMGARQHPMSGAGRIKEDGSTPDLLIEVKDANKSFTLNGADLLQTRTRAIRQGKTGCWVITFANGLTATLTLE